MKILAQKSQQSQKGMVNEPTNHLKDDAHLLGFLASPRELKMENLEVMYLSCQHPVSVWENLVYQVLQLLEILAVTPHLLEPHQSDFKKVQ